MYEQVLRRKTTPKCDTIFCATIATLPRENKVESLALSLFQEFYVSASLFYTVRKKSLTLEPQIDSDPHI